MTRAEGPQPTDSLQQTVPADGKVSAYAKKATVASCFGYAMDGFDLLIIGFVLPSVTGTFGLSATQAGSLSTFTLIGTLAGGVLFGILSDYIGRIKVFTWSILIFAVFTGLTAAAWDYSLLAVFRFLAGIGLGGEYGIGMALATEAWPAKKRGRGAAWVANGWQLGTLLAVGVSAGLLPLGGWRLVFAVGAGPAIFAYFLRRKMEEPMKFVQAQQKRTGFPVRALVADAKTSRISIGVLILTSVQNFGYYGIITWMPTYLSKDFGMAFTKSAGWTGVTVAGMIVGVFVFGKVLDTIGRRLSFFLWQVGTIVSLIVYANLTSAVVLLVMGAVLGFFVNGMMGGYGALISELYPTEARATAQNVLWNCGRGVAALAPLVVGAVSAAYGFSIAIGAIAIIYVIDMFALLLIPERKGAELT